jgi:hypothetical protein
VETLFGRRRYFPIFQARARTNREMVARAEREAINHPIQGTAADIIKLAMIALHRRLREGGYRARIILQVHDELLLEVPDEEVDAVRSLVVETMSSTVELDVPLKVEVSTGRNWLELKELAVCRYARFVSCARVAPAGARLQRGGNTGSAARRSGNAGSPAPTPTPAAVTSVTAR